MTGRDLGTLLYWEKSWEFTSYPKVWENIPGTEHQEVKSAWVEWGMELIFSKNQERTDPDGTSKVMERVASDGIGKTGGNMM